MKKQFSILLALALLISALSGCGSSSAGQTQDPESGSSSSAGASTDTSENGQTAVTDVKHVIVGTCGRPKPFIFLDEDDRVTGFEAEVIYAIDELLDEYEFEFEIVSDTSAIFTGMDAGLYDMAANNLSWTEERAEKYIRTDESVSYSYTGAVVRIDDDSIHSLEDLGGKRASTKVEGGIIQLFLEEYNEQHPDNQVDLVYTSSVPLKVFQDLIEGAYDFTLETATIYYTYIETYPELAESLKFVEFSEEEAAQIESSPYSYYCFPKTEEAEALKEAVDGALRQLKEDGTLNELSQEFLHYDVVR